jgi:hypothetical protein
VLWERARISRPSSDLWCGKSWHDFGESWATRTRREPAVQRKKRPDELCQQLAHFWDGEAQARQAGREVQKEQEERWSTARSRKSLESRPEPAAQA